MAEGLNRVMLLGNLGADPELKMTSGGQAVLKLRLATSETYLDRNKVRQERTEWHSVVVWGSVPRRSVSLTKGSRLFIEGGLRTSNYDDKDGGQALPHRDRRQQYHPVRRRRWAWRRWWCRWRRRRRRW